jgi:hypothetical protein
MDELKINIEGTPPSKSQLDQIREETDQIAAKASIAERNIKRVSWALGTVGFIVLALLSWTGMITGEMAVVGAVVGAVAVVGAGVVAGAVAMVRAYENLVEIPREQSSSLLASITEMTANDNPDQCNQYFEWYEHASTLQKYQRQVAAQDRNPVMAEYQAAEAWIEGTDASQTQAESINRARIACERLRTADQ